MLRLFPLLPYASRSMTTHDDAQYSLRAFTRAGRPRHQGAQASKQESKKTNGVIAFLPFPLGKRAGVRGCEPGGCSIDTTNGQVGDLSHQEGMVHVFLPSPLGRGAGGEGCFTCLDRLFLRSNVRP